MTKLIDWSAPVKAIAELLGLRKPTANTPTKDKTPCPKSTSKP